MRRSSIIYILIITIILVLCCPVGSFSGLEIEAAGLYNNSYYTNNSNQKISKYETSDIAGNATDTDAGYLPVDAPEINASSAIVMDIDTGDILYEKDIHGHYYPAGITKVVTALIAIEEANVNDNITISESVMSQLTQNSSVVGFKLGENVTVRDTLYAIMFCPSQDASLALSEYVAGSSSGFADKMNERMTEFGLTDTHFVNPSGVHEEDQYTSCYDMAIVGKTAYQYPEFRNLISSLSYTIPATNKSEERVLWTENLQIYGSSDYFYKYCTGGKTGYTDNSLYTLLSYVERDGRRLICIVMRCDTSYDSYNDTRKLCDFCLDSYRLCKPLYNYDVNSEIVANTQVLENYYNDLNHELPKYYVNQNISFYVRSFIDDNEIEKNISMHDKLYDDKAGIVSFFYNGEYYGQTDIYIDLPEIVASSTDALRYEKDAKKSDSKYFRIVLISVSAIVLIVSLVFVLNFFGKVRHELQMHKAKRTARYFPIKRDTRLYPKKKEDEDEKKLQ